MVYCKKYNENEKTPRKTLKIHYFTKINTKIVISKAPTNKTPANI